MLRLLLAGLIAAILGGHAAAQPATSPEKAADPGVVIVPKLEGPPRAKAPSEKDFAGYAMVYFKDETHGAYLAVSRDGYSFTDVNDGDPVFLGEHLAEQHGVRDPHIARGPDGAFYLAMTDLHIYGDRKGFRSERWQRPEDAYGWGNNRALVLMKSHDLIHWTHAVYRVDSAFPELGDIGCTWAPQTIYDPAEGKMMVYFTMRFRNGAPNIYYAYANDDFTAFESTPQRLTDIDCIDADIAVVDGVYHMHYVAGGKVYYAKSDRLDQGYVARPGRIDPERVSTEAPNVFRRLDTGAYVLMYDVYAGRPNNMGFSETTDFEHYTHLGRFNEGVMKGVNFERPKHGAVTHLTESELAAVVEHWGVSLKAE
ncbi:Glycosyl hydrolases family 43 [Pseudobythopirellula maris]|uniref:Glycosyl hydrolases family 43 n=1 Tax=Pseudobythopirellula maris TaxID=2527991 RepID=A0A5C5ZQU9_9BACT|nr:glycoside hydrolase family 43 protein [Pseudobythopirellula maris]TWT89859.1 Glycosyl hydrolases family 43 [Pseudobythopirellula maris]